MAPACLLRSLAPLRNPLFSFLAFCSSVHPVNPHRSIHPIPTTTKQIIIIINSIESNSISQSLSLIRLST
ncbi:Uncharacterized protein HZ326_16807 [Fusarium oxysporum f. sp. albedinis]|nr:Uncharacterized protein HZ326_16807 [Fusarium oxysporum f. sp. albedinis]